MSIELANDSIFFLLGAGASVDAGIPHAAKMVKDFEEYLNTPDLVGCKPLYLFLKSATLFQRGLDSFEPHNVVGIEDILNIMESLRLKHKNVLYPYIGNWSYHLISVAGNNFENIEKLDKAIRHKLFDWVGQVQSYNNANYLARIGDFSKDIGSSIRIFTLNYDICVETAFKNNNLILESGFDEMGHWDAERFITDENSQKNYYLYKLHGSIDWRMDELTGLPKKYPQPVIDAQLIFGTSVKLNSLDPYLYYVFEFRKFSLNRNLRFLVIIGYSFSDGYINQLIRQALKRNNNLKIIIVSPDAEEEKNNIMKKLEIKDHLKLIAESKYAKDYLQDTLNYNYFLENLDKNDDLPF